MNVYRTYEFIIPYLLQFWTFREVHEEVSEARERASELKLRRQEQAVARREKLRQAYIKKQLEKMKSASATKQEQT